MATSAGSPKAFADCLPSTGSTRASRRGFLSAQARAVLATSAVMAMLGVASVPWWLATPSRVSGFIARSVPELDAAVRIGNVSLGWIGPLVLEDVLVVPRDGSDPPISIDRVELSHGLAGILLSLGDLGRVRLAGLGVHLVFDAERNSNIRNLLRPSENAAADDGAQRGRRAAVRLRLEVDGAVVRIDGPWAAETWVSDPIQARAALAPADHGRWSEWTVEPVDLLTDARLEPAVAQGVLAYIAPVMANATRTAGRVSLRLDGATLPLGAPKDGQFSGSLSMHSVDLGPGPLVLNLLEALPLNLPAPPAIRIADESQVEFRLAERRVWHEGLEFGVPLAKPGQRLDLESSGSVGLDAKDLDLKLRLPIPADLPQDRPVLAALAGRTFSVGIGGFLGEPKVSFDGSLRANAGGVLAEVLGRLRAGGGQPVGRPQGATAPEPNWSRPGPQAGSSAKPLEKAAAAPSKESAPAQKNDDRPAPPPKSLDGTRGGGGETGLTTLADDSGDAARSDGSAAADRVKDLLPPDLKQDATADAVIDLVGGVIGELAKRRAERRAAEAANPEPPQPARRGRLLRRGTPAGTQAPAGTQGAAPAPTPALEPVPQQPAASPAP
ncbi:MAG: hypothetical protein ACKOTB_10715 [Planctomycetia bacterium]